MPDQAVVALALVAGAVAAFNPCGFALLPAYFGLVAVDDRAPRRAMRFAAGMTVGFVVVFGVVGAVLAPLAVSIERYLPVVTVVMGVLLVGLGCWPAASWPCRVSAGGRAPSAGSWWSQVGYGCRSRSHRCPARSPRSWP